MKECFKCLTRKPLSDFYRHPKMADGHLNKCKECTMADVRANYRASRPARQEYERMRAALPHRVALRAESQKRHRQEWPEKYRARYAVSNAVRNGRLAKTPCEVCGNQKSEGHHADYSKPLHVRWLCRAHHFAIEGRSAIPA